jgi:hypothetical protein
MKAFDVPTPEELIQKPQSDRGQHEKGMRNHCKDFRDESTWFVTHLYMKAVLGISLYSSP